MSAGSMFRGSHPARGAGGGRRGLGVAAAIPARAEGGLLRATRGSRIAAPVLFQRHPGLVSRSAVVSWPAAKVPPEQPIGPPAAALCQPGPRAAICHRPAVRQELVEGPTSFEEQRFHVTLETHQRVHVLELVGPRCAGSADGEERSSIVFLVLQLDPLARALEHPRGIPLGGRRRVVRADLGVGNASTPRRSTRFRHS